MRRKIISILIITLLIISIGTSSFATFTNISLEEIKVFLEKKMQEDEEFESVTVEGNSLKINVGYGLELALFYDSVENTLYGEETFSNGMDTDLAALKMERNRNATLLCIFCISRKKWGCRGNIPTICYGKWINGNRILRIST